MDWKVVLSTFGLLFIAELGDKTQLAVITLSGRTQKPWPVFIGAVVGLAAVTLIGALGGSVVLRFVPVELLRKLAAAGFVAMGVAMWLKLI